MITVGIDEVGRGSWAGPLVAAAVALSSPVEGLKDSKKLSKLQREKLLIDIKIHALAIGVGWVQPQEIDAVGLTQAVSLAMHRALEQVHITFDELIVDGNINYFTEDARSQAIICADDLVPCVSAASIVAKVARDNYMTNVAHSKYPEYAFDQHVGYGTSLHQQLLRLYGACELHRQSFRPVRAIMAAAV